MMDLRYVSDELERWTGYDSISTIKQKYSINDRGSFECCFPDCSVVRRQVEMMWMHVHFSSKHGLSFDAATPEEAWRKLWPTELDTSDEPR
jgi:hypothetical protein